MSDAGKQSESHDAPTYADLLEEAGRASFSYLTRGALRSMSCLEWCGCIGFSLLFLSPIIIMLYLFYSSPPYRRYNFRLTEEMMVFLFPVVIGWGLVAIGRIPRSVKVENGTVTFYRFGLPYAKIEIADVRWVGALESARFIFLSRGRRQPIPISLSGRHRKKENRLFGMLAELGRLRVTEEAENFTESEIPVAIPLAEGATRRRLPGLTKGLLFLLPSAVVLLLLAVVYSVLGFRQEPVFFYFVPVFLVLGIYFLVLFIKGMKRAILSYWYSREEFTPAGYRAKDFETPYSELKLTFYRGLGDILDPDPGVLEISIPEKEPIYIGPERQNFFALPFVLEEWAGDSFRIEPLEKAPEGARGIPFYDRLWQKPKGSFRIFGRRRG